MNKQCDFQREAALQFGPAGSQLAARGPSPTSTKTRPPYTLLLVCKYLREQLALAEQFMSRGISRGWSPQFQRED
jgi:hypothetical protein